MRRLSGVPLLHLIAALVAGVLVVACSTSDEPATPEAGAVAPGTADSAPVQDSRPGPGVAWTECGGGLECATVAVPIDHDDPAGPTTEVALVRVPATDSAQRIGSLFVNPGGPGGSGIDMVEGGFRFDDETMARFDLVGFDPRGIGRSDPLACEADLTTGPLPDPDPDSAEERQDLDEPARAMADRCAQAEGARLAHLHSSAVARDLDVLRAAVGDEVLNYYGFSYGTLIGLRYLELFPERAGRVVLDGVVDPTATLPELLAQQAAAFERVFTGEMARACAASPACPEGGLVAAYDEVRGRLEERTVGEVGPAELATAAVMATYDPGLWDALFRALAAALAGDVSGLESLSDLYYGSTSFAVYAAVSCTDTPLPTGSEGWDALAAETAAISPRFGAAAVNELRVCAHWPVAAQQAPGPIRAEGSDPVLVIGTTGDAATPLENAVAVAEQLASGHLLTHVGEGHAAYGTSACVADVVNGFLVHGRVPAEGARC